MADERLTNLRGPGRRQFLRWAATVGAVLGLDRARFLDALSGTAGVAMADQAACATTCRSVSIVFGNGALSRATLLFPHVAVAMDASGQFANQAPGQAKKAVGTNQPWVFTPQSPFQSNKPTRAMTGFLAGVNETHTSTPSTATTIDTGVGMIAAIAAIQQANPTLLPVIGVNPIVYGNASGAPAVATVASSAGLVDLFNSAASHTLLQSSGNAALHESYYKAFLGLNAAAGRQTMAVPFGNSKVAANLLGRNLASQLAPTAADDANYGITPASATTVVELAHSLCIAVKAFRLGLATALVIPAYRDDPHTLFANGLGTPVSDSAELGKIFDAFMADCQNSPDPSCTSSTLADNIVMTMHGDTGKDPLNPNGWPDNTPGNSNWMYVYGNGYLKTGWFGSIDTAGNVNGWDPVTGNAVPGQASSVTAAAASAAAAYAVAKGDMRRVEDFYKGGPISGVINASQM
jgi:hypothetical protein